MPIYMTKYDCWKSPETRRHWDSEKQHWSRILTCLKVSLCPLQNDHSYIEGVVFYVVWWFKCCCVENCPLHKWPETSHATSGEKQIYFHLRNFYPMGSEGECEAVCENPSDVPWPRLSSRLKRKKRGWWGNGWRLIRAMVEGEKKHGAEGGRGHIPQNFQN